MLSILMAAVMLLMLTACAEPTTEPTNSTSHPSYSSEESTNELAVLSSEPAQEESVVRSEPSSTEESTVSSEHSQTVSICSHPRESLVTSESSVNVSSEPTVDSSESSNQSTESPVTSVIQPNENLLGPFIIQTAAGEDVLSFTVSFNRPFYTLGNNIWYTVTAENLTNQTIDITGSNIGRGKGGAIDADPYWEDNSATIMNTTGAVPQARLYTTIEPGEVIQRDFLIHTTMPENASDKLIEKRIYFDISLGLDTTENNLPFQGLDTSFTVSIPIQVPADQ